MTGNTFFFQWEVSLMEWLQSRLGGSALSVISTLSMFGEELLLILVLGFMYWCWDKRIGKRMGLTVLMAGVWNPMVKNVFLRRRPYMDHESVEILRVVEPDADPMNIAAQGYSFPSGHSTNAAGMYGSLAMELRKKWTYVLAVLIPVLVGISRVTVGAHYPTDVLGGWVVAAVAMLLVPWLRKKIANQWVLYGVLLLTAIPGFFFCRSSDFYTGFGLLFGFMAGTILEERYTRFENTRNVLRCALRLVGGIAVFFVLNKALKLPFSPEFLEGGSMGALLVRCVRYALISFIEFGVYPLVFRYTAKIGRK